MVHLQNRQIHQHRGQRASIAGTFGDLERLFEVRLGRFGLAKGQMRLGQVGHEHGRDRAIADLLRDRQALPPRLNRSFPVAPLPVDNAHVVQR